MPLYKYVCPKCGHEVTLLKKISDADNVICDVCGSKMVRQIGNVGVVFKGSGYYITDSKKSSSSNSSKSSKAKETVKSKS
ncbi:FmdB family zinc ribbon protein [Mesoaciditoga sp.]